MEDKLGRGDDTVGSLFLNPRKAAEGLVGDIFSKPRAPDVRAAQLNSPDDPALLVRDGKADGILRSDFSARVIQPPNLKGPAARHGDAPQEQIVDSRSPEDRGFSSGVFRNVSTDRAGPCAGGIGGENQAVFSGVIHGVAGNYAGFQTENRPLFAPTVIQGKGSLRDAPDPVEFFRVDDHTIPVNGNTSAGQPGSGSPGNDVQSEFGNGIEERGNLGFLCGADDGQRKVQPPVRGIGGVADQGKRVKKYVFIPDNGAKCLADATSPVSHVGDFGFDGRKVRPATGEDGLKFGNPIGVGRYGIQVSFDRAEKPAVTGGGVNQVLIDERVAPEDEHLAHESHQQLDPLTGPALKAYPFKGIPDR